MGQHEPIWCKICSNMDQEIIEKPMFSYVFAYREFMRKTSPRTSKSLEKPRKRLPEFSRNTSKWSPKRSKTQKNCSTAIQNAASSAERPQEGPKSEKYCQHGPNMAKSGSGSLILWLCCPPLSMLLQVFKCSIFKLVLLF